jgi:hypothetical protein
MQGQERRPQRGTVLAGGCVSAVPSTLRRVCSECSRTLFLYSGGAKGQRRLWFCYRGCARYDFGGDVTVAEPDRSVTVSGQPDVRVKHHSPRHLREPVWGCRSTAARALPITARPSCSPRFRQEPDQRRRHGRFGRPPPAVFAAHAVEPSVQSGRGSWRNAAGCGAPKLCFTVRAEHRGQPDRR